MPFGYSVVAAAFTLQGLAIGLSLAAYPVLMASVESEFGATRTQASLGIPLLLLASALASPWVGKRVDTGSAKRVMAEGSILMLLGFVLLAQTASLWAAALCWMGLVGVGQAMLGPLPAMTVVARWFVLRRGQMIAIAAMGTTVGGALVPPLAEWLVGGFGWRTAVIAFGATAFLLGVPVAWFGIVDSPEERGLHPDGADHAPALEPEPDAGGGVAGFFRDSNFWLVALGFGLTSGAGIAFLTHAVPYALENGLAREEAVAVLTVNALCAAIGKLLFGNLTDRLGARHAVWIAIALEVAGWLGILSASGSLQYIASAALFSLGLGSMIPCQAGFVARLYGRARFGQASGLVGMVSMLGVFLIAPAVGIGYDAFGSYARPMSAILGAVALPALLLGIVRFADEVDLDPAAAREAA